MALYELPIYDLICTHGHRFRRELAPCELFDQSCHICGANCRQEHKPTIHGGIVMVKGSKMVYDRHTSVTEWHPSHDAKRMADELGPIGAKCIQADGSVRFLDRRDRSKYLAAKKRYEARQRERAADHELSERDEVKRGNMIEIPETVPFGGLKKNKAEKGRRKMQRNPRVLTRRSKRN